MERHQFIVSTLFFCFFSDFYFHCIKYDDRQMFSHNQSMCVQFTVKRIFFILSLSLPLSLSVPLESIKFRDNKLFSLARNIKLNSFLSVVESSISHRKACNFAPPFHEHHSFFSRPLLHSLSRPLSVRTLNCVWFAVSSGFVVVRLKTITKTKPENEK